MKKLILATLLLMCSLIVIGSVKADVTSITLNNPPQDNIISGTEYWLNATTVPANANVTNVTFFYSTDSGVTWVTICTNDSAGATSNTIFGCKLTTSTITDALDLIFNASAGNDSTANIIVSDSSTGVDVDDTNPIASFTVDKGFTRRSDAGGITVDCGGSSDATVGIQNYSVTLTKPDTTTVTTTDKLHSFTLSDIDSTGQYSVACQVWDVGGLTNTASSQTFEVYSGKDGELTTATTTVATRARGNLYLYVIVIVIVLVSVFIVSMGLYKIYSKKKR